ncbi:MAG: fibronectin type III domain-containing protein, partial [Bacteroides sp.]|nr:fibronectin type III domain-containing protein [Bacteroides sp.]
TDYIISITKQEATPLNEVLTTFDDLPQGWRTNASGYTSDEALCGNDAPALYFEKKGYLMTSQYDENIRKVYFHLVVENASAGAQLRVMGTSPGSYAWKEIEIIDLDDFTGPQFSNFNVPEDIRGLYIEFVPAGDCKIALDDLRIEYGGTVKESSQHEVYTGYSAGNVSSLKIEDLVPDTQYEYNVQAVNDTHHARVSNTVVVRTREMSGVEDVDIDINTLPAEYYNLQGVRVAEPTPGHIYIQRRGTASRKVLITK